VDALHSALPPLVVCTFRPEIVAKDNQTVLFAEAFRGLRQRLEVDELVRLQVMFTRMSGVRKCLRELTSVATDRERSWSNQSA
jgi:hypothetical protein